MLQRIRIVGKVHLDSLTNIKRCATRSRCNYLQRTSIKAVAKYGTKFYVMKKIKQWILYNVIARFSYNYWIILREKSKDEYDEKLCYCGHTHKCSCSNPDKKLFRESVRNGSIILSDKNNGWKNVL